MVGCPRIKFFKILAPGQESGYNRKRFRKTAFEKSCDCGIFQRAGGWCEPVREAVFPLFKLVVKTTGRYPISYL